jgi:hypothetical protein
MNFEGFVDEGKQVWSDLSDLRNICNFNTVLNVGEGFLSGTLAVGFKNNPFVAVGAGVVQGGVNLINSAREAREGEEIMKEVDGNIIEGKEYTAYYKFIGSVWKKKPYYCHEVTHLR